MNERSSALVGAAVLGLSLLQCDKEKAPPGESVPPVASTASAAATSPVASAAPVPSATPPKDDPAPTAGAVAPDAGAKAVATGGKDAGAGANALKPVTKHVTAKNFAIDLASPGCKATEDCTLAIKLSPSGEFHVNKEYPYKFIATPAPNVAFLGKSDPNTFARSSGDFTEQGEKAATMTVRFKPASAGQAKVAGKYKLSVCSAEQCLIEEAMVDVDVPVL